MIYPATTTALLLFYIRIWPACAYLLLPAMERSLFFVSAGRWGGTYRISILMILSKIALV